MIYQGVRLQMTSIGDIYSSAIAEIRQGLVQCGATRQLPSELSGQIRDLGETHTLYASAPAVFKPCIQAALEHIGARADVFPQGPSSPPAAVVAQGLMNTFSGINDQLLVAMFLGGGMPSRGSEFVGIHFAPSLSAKRQVFMEASPNGAQLWTKIKYNKVGHPASCYALTCSSC